MPQFLQLVMSNPAAFAAVGAALQGTATQFNTVGQGFTAGTNVALATWQGTAKSSAEKFAARFTTGLSGMGGCVRQAGSTATQGGNALQALVLQIRVSMQTAQAAGFLVLPNGQVFPGPTHYAQAAAAGPGAGAVMQMYQAVARMWTMYFNGMVQTATAQDQMVARAIQAITMQLDSKLPFRSQLRARPWFVQTPTGGWPTRQAAVNANNQRRGELANELNELWTARNGERVLGVERRIMREPGNTTDFMRADRITVDPSGRVHVYEVKSGSSEPTPAQQDILPRLPQGGPQIGDDGMAQLPRGTVIRPGEVSVHVQRWDVDSLPPSVRTEVYNGHSLTDIMNGRAGSQQAQQQLANWFTNPASQVSHTL